jgi:hypothetical protein
MTVSGTRFRRGQIMDDFQGGKPGGQNSNKPIPFNNGLEVRHSPLNLGGGSDAAPQAEPELVADERPVVKDTGKKVSWPDRITGVKTFFTKRHPGAMEFLDETICKWLADNPGVTIRLTNVTVGDIVAKKTEPNIIITVWF